MASRRRTIILAIEGPDGIGKSTLFRQLRERGRLKAFFVDMPELPPELFAVMSWVEERQAQLWSALYDPASFYICDRTVFTSSVVYAKLFNRVNRVDLRPWLSQVCMVRLTMPNFSLKLRLLKRGDPFVKVSQVDELIKLYNQLRNTFRCFSFNVEAPDLVEQVEAYAISLGCKYELPNGSTECQEKAIEVHER